MVSGNEQTGMTTLIGVWALNVSKVTNVWQRGGMSVTSVMTCIIDGVVKLISGVSVLWWHV